MAKIQFLTILLTVTCFLGGVVSVTDTELEDLVGFVHQQAATLDEQSRVVKEQSIQIEKLSITVEEQSALIQHLTKENKVRMEEIRRQDTLIQKLNSVVIYDVTDGLSNHEQDLILNTTIEERVSLLEIQVVEIQEDMSEVDERVELIEGDVDFLFDEQVIQDERLLNMQQTTIGILGDLDNLEDTTFTLDFRVTALEVNGGDDGNSSVAELEVRVETLEGTAADHQTRISAVETDVNDLEESDSDHETRLPEADENIQGLQMTDVELDARVTALEETGVTFAFHAILPSAATIYELSPVLFDDVLLNEGDGYDSTTGTFTVPSDGDGYYYFSVYLIVEPNESGVFHMEINEAVLCTAYTDQTGTFTDPGPATCSATTYATEGDRVQVVYIDGLDTTPVYGNHFYHYTGFTGFRI